MDLPKIDLASLPGLENAQGVFGSLKQVSAAYDDGVISIMVYVYDTGPPPGVI